MVHNYTLPRLGRPYDPIAWELQVQWATARRVVPVRHRALTAKGTNKEAFTGILCLLDQASDKAPGGSEGRRVIIPSAVARAKLGTLVSMPVNVSQDLKDHDRHTIVGTIQRAWIDQNR